jgi:hypothetical protein
MSPWCACLRYYRMYRKTGVERRRAIKLALGLLSALAKIRYHGARR